MNSDLSPKSNIRLDVISSDEKKYVKVCLFMINSIISNAKKSDPTFDPQGW